MASDVRRRRGTLAVNAFARSATARLSGARTFTGLWPRVSERG